MDGLKNESFQYAIPRPRPDFRRPFSDGSMTIPTSELAASLPNPNHFMAFSYDQQPFLQSFAFNNEMIPPPPATTSFNDRSRSLSRGGNIGKAPRSRSGRKGSMTDVKPTMPRVRTASNRTMSYSHPDGRIGLGLDTHIEGEHTNSVSPPDYAYGLPHSWNGSGSGSLPSMQSFGTTIDEAILDSPVSPNLALPALPQDADEESKKQRRRECHNQVEKRRREHINTKIEELAHLLPPQYQQLDEGLEEEDEEEQGSPKKKKNRRNSMAKQKDLAHCKGRILTHSVQYIQDLRHVNTLQAARILQLESLIAGASFANPQSLLSHQPQLQGQHQQQQQELPTPSHASNQVFFEPQGLEMMRPSPEPEPFAPPTWNPFNPVFEPSPDAYNNSSSSGGSSVQPEKPTHMRHDSQLELQMSMTGMDLDAVFARREDDHAVRW